jgi:hypothetical protein
VPVSGAFTGGTTVIFCRVLLDAKERFDFEMRGLVLKGAWLSFYIKPADGYQLPEITRRMKQTFSVRFNVKTGRTGHVWGDRYWSEILEGEPPQSRTAVTAREASPVAWGLTPNGARRGKTGLAPEFAFSDSFPPHKPAPRPPRNRRYHKPR